MCFEIAGSVISNGSASSLTVASPSARRARIARRVELASAAKVSLSRSSSSIIVMVAPYLPEWIIKQSGKYTPLPLAVNRDEGPKSSFGADGLAGDDRAQSNGENGNRMSPHDSS